MPAIASLTELDLSTPVTFFIGENGTGKSTLLEGIAEYAGFDREGGSRHARFAIADTHGNASSFTRMAAAMRAVWDRRPRDGFYLRAESFFNFANYLDELDKDHPGSLRPYGGTSLHLMSHGEAFLTLFRERLRSGLFLLDEPEAALSLKRQLTLLSIIASMTTSASDEPPAQFIIATHSPILLAFPGARIYTFDGDAVQPIAYDDVPSVELARAFMKNPDSFLRHLVDDPERF